MQRTSPTITIRRQRGAALLLLLLAAGLGVGALLIGAMGTPSGTVERDLQTLRALEAAKRALLGYAQLTGRLPMPAASVRSGTESPELCVEGAACAGFIPWVTLGIPATDSWGKLLRYSVTADLTRSPLLRLHAVADRRILNRDAAGKLAYRAGQADCFVETPCVAAVILSNGQRNFGTSELGLRLANGGVNNLDEQHNNRAVRDFISRPKTDSTLAPGGEFDDLLVWIPLHQLYKEVNAAGKLP